MKELKKISKLLRQGDFLLEVEIDSIQDEDDPWAPYYTTEMVKRLYDARNALVHGEFDIARKFGKLYRIVPEDADLDLSFA